MNIQETLGARLLIHGKFPEHAMATVKLKEVVKECLCEFGKSDDHLLYVHAEALDMILHKIGRIVAGDPMHADHWHDIAGYALLAEEGCHTEGGVNGLLTE